MVSKPDYDAVVVGSGPNGLAAAITLQKAGLSVLVLEGKKIIGGGLRSEELTLPHFVHDVCSAVYPLAASSPFLKTLPLDQHGLKFIQAPIAAAHPFDDGRAAVLYPSVEETAKNLVGDEQRYLNLFGPLAKSWPTLATDVLAPFHFPKDPLTMLKFGMKALRPATHLARHFHTREARGLIAGMAAHSIQPLTDIATSSSALVLMIAAHSGGWPIPKGGAGALAKALCAYFVSLGGTVKTDFYVSSLEQVPLCQAILFDVGPQQLLQIAGHRLSSIYKWQLSRFRYGMGVFKIDWALGDPIPFLAPACRQAGVVHLGNSLEQIVEAEELTAEGYHPEKPFVLLAQPSLFDKTRAPKGKHTAWAYCHVPNGSTIDMTERIEKQIEHFAPGFKERILARHTMNTVQMEEYNPNYIGGDITGGIMNLGQLFTRPALRFSPYRTSARGIYLCSSSTPPGGGVHGMCGYYAAKRAMKDIFKKNTGFSF